jgi:hypothetical protein
MCQQAAVSYVLPAETVLQDYDAWNGQLSWLTLVHEN